MIYKTTIQKFTRFPEDIIGIAMPGSEQWAQCMEMLRECYNREAEDNNLRSEVGTCKMTLAKNWTDVPAYDFMEYFPETFKDPECLEIDCSEEQITGLRRDYNLSECIAILISPADHPNRPEHNGNQWLQGTTYQLLYPGDTVYVMNDYGATIHTIK